MLDLHRASAGSGKTYTLAKKYIWYLITISPEGAPRRLRTDAELADSAHHILAVTFTNKATNEMQLRIVDKLFELATRAPEWKKDRSGVSRIVAPDYMGDFTTTLHEGPERVAAVCRKALSILLENYSDFKVSTIDSFFQLVLRTFAYESELNDTYQVELDSEFLSQVGVDGTLEEIDANSSDHHTPYWIRKLMDRGESKWNIFTRKYSTDSFGANPYLDFVKSVCRLENEEYKMIRDEVEDYFRSGPDFITLYEDLAAKYETPVRRAFLAMRRECAEMCRMLPEDLLQAGSRTAVGQLVTRLRKLATAPKNGWNRAPDDTIHKYFSEEYLAKPVVAKALKSFDAAAITAGVMRCADAFAGFEQAWNDETFQHWRLYAVNLPYLALFSIVSRKRQDYLNETNAVELGETSMILRGVIGDSDAPFIYERLGTYLNHFLIDEFQDTSRLQWENLRPLLVESMSRDNDNLIIGDAKQSIYRFRNADPSLITSVVPEQFGDSVNSLGSRPEENTNYRSRLRVVQFNNSFFEYLASRLDREAALTNGARRMFGPLYSNVVQTPFKTAPEGYVEVTLPGPKQKDFGEYVLARVPELVKSLTARGYRQKDIAVLVSSNRDGEAVIKSFVDYNAALGGDGEEIRFVSEQSLKVAGSRAVKIVLGVLENMARGFNPEIREGEERVKKGVGTWAEMESSFKFFAMGREGETMPEILDAYLDERPDMERLSAVLDRLQSLAIPAIVEAVVASFIPDSLRQMDAVYLSAFQDLVLEYCDGHPTDIGSFLKWWERKSRTASISSPEDTDAVQVLTVHKSKGLEYDCVIIPFADWNFADSVSSFKKEWRWVRPMLVSHPDIEMPPYIPVETTDALESTRHRDLLYEYYDMVKMDALNSAYVAFTRAGRELYIFSDDRNALSGSSGKSKSGDDLNGMTPEYFKLGRYLYDFVNGLSVRMEGVANTDLARLEADVVSEEMPADETSPYVARAGVLPDEVSRKHNGEGNDAVVIGDYRSVVPGGEELKYRQGDLPDVIEAADVEDDEDPADLDPRSEGNIKHAVLELVRVPGDLHHAVRHLCITGLIPLHMAEEIEKSLRAGLEKPTVSRWFDGKARVINERPILKAGHVSRRPDRILVYPDGHAEVVDYKFGKYDTKGKYRRQISGYVRRLAETGMYTNVEGYLWYVNADIIEKV